MWRKLTQSPELDSTQHIKGEVECEPGVIALQHRQPDLLTLLQLNGRAKSPQPGSNIWRKAFPEKWSLLQQQIIAYGFGITWSSVINGSITNGAMFQC